MTKKVRYNGGTESYTYSTNPKCLVVGKEYEVVSETVLNFQTNYTLRGVEGEFNSVWFDEVITSETKKSNKVINLAISEVLPNVGEGYHCAKIDFIDGKPKLLRCLTSPVKEFEEIGVNTYLVKTNNSIYVVKVNIVQ